MTAEANDGGVRAPDGRGDLLTSLEKGLMILSQLATAERGMTVSAIARAAGLNRTTTYRLCHDLERHGWIQRSGERTSTFDLGPRMLGISVVIESRYDTEKRIAPIIKQLAQQVGETVHVAILDGNHVITIGRAFPDDGPNMAQEIGSREMAHVTGLGKALLAGLERDAIHRLYPAGTLPGRTKSAILTVEELLDDLERTAARGWSLDDEESRPGVRCVGAAVWGPSARPSVAISVTAAPTRAIGPIFDELVQAVTRAGALATEALGGKAPEYRPGRFSDRSIAEPADE